MVLMAGCSDNGDPRNVSSDAEPSAPIQGTAPAPEVTADEAYFYAQQAVKEKLKAPSTAKFATPRIDAEARIMAYGYRQWLCSGWVDSQNSFGAMLRTQ